MIEKKKALEAEKLIPQPMTSHPVALSIEFRVLIVAVLILCGMAAWFLPDIINVNGPDEEPPLPPDQSISLDAARSARNRTDFDLAIKICASLEKNNGGMAESASQMKKECEILRKQFVIAEDLQKKYFMLPEAQSEWKWIYYSLASNDPLRNWIWRNRIQSSTTK